jgi:hypothetical protein
MPNAFAQLKINPFADDVVTEPRRVSYSVGGLNVRPLELLIAKFSTLTIGELPRKAVVDRKAQLVFSPDRGYGKSHLLGRLFRALGEQATSIYLRPFQDSQRVWISILLATVQELERPNNQGAGSQLEAFSKGVLAHVAADHMSRGPARIYPEVQNAVKNLRADPLKVLSHPGNVLVNWMKSRVDDVAELARCAELLKERGIDLDGRETAWIKVLAGYAFGQAGGLDREAALKWLRADPLETDELKILKLATADNEARGDSSAQEINDLSFRRLKGLCALASYYRPFLFCFDQTEFYGGDSALVHALAKCIWDFHFALYNQLTIVTANSTNWSAEILPYMQPALQDRFDDEKIMLEGITVDQAKELIGKRLRDFQIDDTDIQNFIGDGWLNTQFSSLPQIGVRSLLTKAAQRFRALAAPDAKPPQKTPLSDLFASEVNEIRANKALHRYNQDCLMWFAQALAEGFDGVAIRKTSGRYFALQWAWPDRSIYFAFEAGDNNARWRAIANEGVSLGNTRHFAALVFRTPDLTPIPRSTWGVAKEQIEAAKKRGLQIVALTLDEVCELHAARELYSNALQGNIDHEAAEVLKFLRARFEPWFKRFSQSAVAGSSPEHPPAPAAAPTRSNRARSSVSTHADLSEAQFRVVLDCVNQRMLVDIKEILRALGDESLQPAVLRAIERSANIKAHPGPQTIYLQWRVVA